ncbi:MAG: hypothetical protein GF313_01310 [Caldithrix sp.]|nr:hypothetical protein [Caldithrix sp.]
MFKRFIEHLRKSITTILTITGLFCTSTNAQIGPDSLSSPTDSLKSAQTPYAQQNTAGRPILHSLTATYNARGDLHTQSLFFKESIYHFNQLIYQNYTGTSDIFYNHPEIQIYDFMDMGTPRYIAPVNLLPHQHAVFLDGLHVNNPLNGLFNLQHIPLDMIEQVENTLHGEAFAGTRHSLTGGTHLHSRQLNNENPYTRIMYREGDFGFFNLDITFARKLSDRLAVQLGGINKYYDPVSNTYHGFQYRGGFRYRWSDNLFVDTRFQLNREQRVMTRFINFNTHKYREDRDAVYGQLTYLPQKYDSTTYWRLQWSATGDRNTVRSNEDTFRVDQYFDYYHLAVSHQRPINKLNIKLRMGMNQNRFWGTPFHKRFIRSALELNTLLEYPLAQNLNVRYVMHNYLREQDGLSKDGDAVLRWHKKQNWLALSLHYKEREALPQEDLFHYQEIRPISALENESMTGISLSGQWKPWSNLKINGRLAHRSIYDEIVWRHTHFDNSSNRNFSAFVGSIRLGLWKFKFNAGGQFNLADIHLSPERSAWGQLRYHDRWLKGAIIIDATANAHWYGQHNRIRYQPVLQRFYWDTRETSGYYVFSYKIVATVKNAQLYMAMDNPFSYEYEYIYGYPELYRRIRFGVNWVLWE